MEIAPDIFLEAIESGEPAQPWAAGRSAELCRIFNVLGRTPGLAGPTLDIGSGAAAFFRPIRKFRPELLPYRFTDLGGKPLQIDGESVEGMDFECEKDRLPLPDSSIGVVLFCDVLEHLIVDPVWTLLEINRVLAIGGHLCISTPNVGSVRRAVNILMGYHPGTEHHYKPGSIYDRHNREWTPSEVTITISNLGFEIVDFDTNHQSLTTAETNFLQILRDTGITELPDHVFGPDIVAIARKHSHLTLDMEIPDARRWPDYLYTGYPNYHRRPDPFPNLR